MQNLPLAGIRVVVTRAADQASSLSRGLAERGAEVIEVPTIAIAEPSDGGAALRRSLEDLDAIEWLVVTSPNGARRAADALEISGGAGGLARAGVSVAAIGPGTAEALADHGIAADLVPERFVAEGLLAAFPTPADDAGLVVLAQASGARPVLAEGLSGLGWPVEVVEAYRTVHPSVAVEMSEAVVTADVVTFTSASTVAGYVHALGVGGVPPIVACIGPITADAAIGAGLDVTLVADPHTIPALVEAIVRHVSQDRDR